MKNKSILYIVHNYNTFQKDQIEQIAEKYEKVYVFVRFNVLASIASILPIKALQSKKRKQAIQIADSCSNIEVFLTNVYYLPGLRFYRSVGKKHFKSVLKTIQKNKIDFDLIHCHFLWSSGFVGMELKKIYHKPLVVTGHGYDVYQLPKLNDWWRKTISSVCLNADQLITVSEKNASIIRSLSPNAKVTSIPNGYKKDYFFLKDKKVCRSRLSINKERPVLLTIGNLVPVKGHFFLIEAIEQLKDSYPDLICYIIGSGPLHIKLKKYISEQRLMDSVVLVGPIPHNMLSDWINAADLFVLSSLNEGNPTVMFEALGCGSPFVGTDVGGIPEIIRSGDTGFLCSAEDSEALAICIRTALNHVWNREAIQEFSIRYSWERICDRIHNVHKAVLIN